MINVVGSGAKLTNLCIKCLSSNVEEVSLVFEAMCYSELNELTDLDFSNNEDAFASAECVELCSEFLSK